MKKTFLTASLLTASMIFTSSVYADEYVKHKIEWGDTLSEIALNYDTSMKSVANLNDIENIDLIYVDDVLKIHKEKNDVESESIKEDDSSTEEADESNEDVASNNQSITEKLSSKKSNEDIVIQSVLDKFEDYEFRH